MMDKPRLLPGLLLAALLIAAQSALLLHAFEHDPGAPQGKVCGTCVTGHQLAAGSVGEPAPDVLEPAAQTFYPAAHGGFHTWHTSTARQRGPPATI
jgi:hypothetical protein